MAEDPPIYIIFVFTSGLFTDRGVKYVADPEIGACKTLVNFLWPETVFIIPMHT